MIPITRLATLIAVPTLLAGCATFRKDLGDLYQPGTYHELMRIDSDCATTKSGPKYDACEAAADILARRDPREATVLFLSFWEDFGFRRPAETRDLLLHDTHHHGLFDSCDRSKEEALGGAVASGIVLARVHGDNVRQREMQWMLPAALRRNYERVAPGDPYAAAMLEQSRVLSFGSSASLNSLATAHVLAIRDNPRVVLASLPAALAANGEPEVRPLERGSADIALPKPEGAGPLFLRTARAGLQEVEAGRRVSVTLVSGERMTGTIVGVAEHGVTLDSDEGELILASREIAQIYRAK